jgi:hypothetical protein
MGSSFRDVQVYEIEAPHPDRVEGTYAIVPKGAADAWESASPSRDLEVDLRPDLVAACDDAVAGAQPPFEVGRGTADELARRLNRAMAWARNHYQPEVGPFETFAGAIARVGIRRFLARVNIRGLRVELADQRARDAALKSESVLVRYLDLVRGALEHRQRRFQRFDRSEDLIADTIVRIIEIVRTDKSARPFARYERAGVPAFVVVFDSVRAAARRQRRIKILGSAVRLPTPEPFPTPEEVLLERERHGELQAVPARLAARLTRRQQEWLATFLEAAGEGGPILSRSARKRGVDKSQATRAAAKIAAAGRRYRVLDTVEPKKPG